MEFIVEKNKIYLNNEEGQEVAHALLEGEGDWKLTSTYVDSSQRGKGIAEKLVAEAVNQARLQGKKIEPICSYAIKQFEVKPEYADVLKK